MRAALWSRTAQFPVTVTVRLRQTLVGSMPPGRKSRWSAQRVQKEVTARATYSTLSHFVCSGLSRGLISGGIVPSRLPWDLPSRRSALQLETLAASRVPGLSFACNNGKWRLETAAPLSHVCQRCSVLHVYLVFFFFFCCRTSGGTSSLSALLSVLSCFYEYPCCSSHSKARSSPGLDGLLGLLRETIASPDLLRIFYLLSSLARF